MSRAVPDERRDPHRWGDVEVLPGEERQVEVLALQSPGGLPVRIPALVRRGREDGPCVLVTAAVHGDEINGSGAVRQLVLDPGFELRRGTLLMVPVVNMLAFERHSRYLPDRRDLNRAFPGDPMGSMARRLAHTIYTDFVQRADVLIDLHSAAVRRTNLPNVRADLSDPETRRLAVAFGLEVVIDSRGPDGSLRREAAAAGRPALLLEAGEVWKVEPTIVETALRGIRNVLAALDMVDAERVPPPYQVLVRRTRWVRAEAGGFLRFHAALGEVVRAGQALATNTSLLGEEQNVLHAPVDGILIGMTTLPSVAPGDAVYHLAQLDAKVDWLQRRSERQPEESLHDRTRSDLSSSVLVAEWEDGGDPDPGTTPGAA